MKPIALALISFFGFDSNSYNLEEVNNPDSFICDTILIDGLAREIVELGFTPTRESVNTLEIHVPNYLEALKLKDKLNDKVSHVIRAVDGKKEFPDLQGMSFQLDLDKNHNYTGAIYLD